MQQKFRCRFDANGMDDILSPQMIRFELMSKIWGFFFEYNPRTREREISHFFISREFHREVKRETFWPFHREITFPAGDVCACLLFTNPNP